MSAGFEQRKHDADALMWAGKYRRLHSLPHWHLEYELIACRGGETRFTLDGHDMTISDGAAAFCPSGGIHHMEADEYATVIVIQFDPELIRFLGGMIQLCTPVFPDRYGIFEQMDEILKDLKAQNPHCGQRANAAMVRLMIDVLRGEPYTVRRDNATLTKYWKLLSAINEESEFIGFSEAAAQMNLSQAYFSRYFKQITGMPFSEYLNLVKVDKAVQILRDQPDITTSDLATRCGFNTLRSFNRVFRKFTGYSPKQLPKDFSFHIRQYAVARQAFDPTLDTSVTLSE